MHERYFGEHGATLIELMAGLAITLVIVAAGFTVLTSSNKAMVINDQTAQTQQSVRVAMELISHDLKMAGFGMSGPVGACNTAIVPADNNIGGADAGPDSFSVVVPTTSSTAPLWTLSAQATGPFNAITLQPSAGTAMASAGFVGGGAISIGGSVSSTATIAGDTLTLNGAIGAPVVFPIGTPVYMLQCITYQIIPPPDPNGLCGAAPCLVRGITAALNCNVAGSPCVSIADGIEDLQLTYTCDGCNAAVNGGVADRVVDDQNVINNAFDQGDFISNTNWASAPLTPDTIRLVQISIVARQAQNDQGFGEGKTAAISTPAAIIVADHNPTTGVFAAGDYNATTYPTQLRRRLLTRTVEARNLGL
ncbi:MAG: PilW family protein [Nitrospiraceae bacterium]